MYKERFKGFICGIMVCFLLISSIFAAPIAKKIDAIFNNIKIVVDGKEIVTRDAKGNKVEPFSYNGSIYLPVRSIGEAFGKKVEWDQKKYTAYIGDKLANQEVVGIGMIEPISREIPIRNGWDSNDGKFIINGREYISSNCLTHYDFACKDGYYYVILGYWMENKYDLNGKYYELSGKFGMDDLSAFGVQGELSIYADDKEVFTQRVTKGDDPIDVCVNLLGVQRIKILLRAKEQTYRPSPGEIYLDFFDVELKRVQQQ